MRKKLKTLVIPMAFQQFMTALVSASDALMLGRLEQSALSAVSLATQITFVFNLFLFSLVLGENMFIAQYYGKKDYKMLRRTEALAIKYVLIIAGVFFVMATFFPKACMTVFTNDTVLIQYGIRYLRFVGLAYFFIGLFHVFQGVLKNCGYVNQVTLISSVVVIMNIVLNAVFIYGIGPIEGMGITGAAVATVISNGVGMVWAIFIVVKQKEFMAAKEDLIARDRGLVRKFWKHALPVFINQLAWGCGFTMYSVIMGHMGNDAVAANALANIIKNLLVCVCLGFGNAAGIILGNLLGAGRLEEAKKQGIVLAKISIWSGVITGLLLLALMPLILRFSNLSPVANGYLKWMLCISSYYVAGKSINSMVICGIFPSGGDTRFGMICDFVTLWCITVPIGLIAAFVLKLPVMAVYFMINIDEIIKLPVVYWYFKKYKWVVNLTKDKQEVIDEGE